MNNKVFVFIFCCLFVMQKGFASCLPSDDMIKTQSVAELVSVYQSCALDYNNDEAQLYLAKLYQKGAKNVPVDMYKSLLYYHLSADNGNAVAQTQFATILLDLDKSPEGRDMVVSYVEQIKTVMKNDKNALFTGAILHPYVLYMLAAESEAGKWYYPTRTKTDAQAKSYLNNYQIDDDKKKQLIAQGSAWKQRKMLETAQIVLSSIDFQRFKNTVFPTQGMVDTFARNQSITNLQKQVKNYTNK